MSPASEISKWRQGVGSWVYAEMRDMVRNRDLDVISIGDIWSSYYVSETLAEEDKWIWGKGSATLKGQVEEDVPVEEAKE